MKAIGEYRTEVTGKFDAIKAEIAGLKEGFAAVNLGDVNDRLDKVIEQLGSLERLIVKQTGSPLTDDTETEPVTPPTVSIPPVDESKPGDV